MCVSTDPNVLSQPSQIRVACPHAEARYDVSGEHRPGLPVVVAHKDEVLRQLAAIVTEIGAPDPDKTAAVVLMLLDGAAAHALIRRNGDPLREARAALPGLLSTL
jgi:tetracycline repressor-like protein